MSKAAVIAMTMATTVVALLHGYSKLASRYGRRNSSQMTEGHFFWFRLE